MSEYFREDGIKLFVLSRSSACLFTLNTGNILGDHLQKSVVLFAHFKRSLFFSRSLQIRFTARIDDILNDIID